jgi:hypothetical protein
MSQLPATKMILSLAVLLACSCASHQLAPAKPVTVLKQNAENNEDGDIREAVFRYQFGHNASGAQQQAAVYFLEILSKDERSSFDPSDEFMARFGDHRPPVRKQSQARPGKGSAPTDRITGEEGLIFRAGEIKRISTDEVQVYGGYYEANLSSSGNTYTVKRVDGKWKVVKNEMHWIS